jgi:uncharacterized protein (DUF58 family)
MLSPSSNSLNVFRSSAPPSSTRFASQALLKNTLLLALWNWYGERFTLAGRWFLGATFVFTATGANSLELQFYVVFLYGAALWVLAWLLTWRSRPNVCLQVRHATRISAGETLPLHVEVRAQIGVRAQKANFNRALWMTARYLAPQLALVPPEGLPLSVLPGESTCQQCGLHCARRGVYTLRGWNVESDFPFGLLRAQQHFSSETSLLVLPRFSPLQSFDLPFNDNAWDGVSAASHVGDSFELLGNRDYRSGDRIRDINWRATARLRQTVVREMCQQQWPRAAVLLDTQIDSSAKRRKSANDQAEHEANFERAVSLCAAVTNCMAREQLVVELFAAGSHLLHIDAQPNTRQLDAILEVLACVQSSAQPMFNHLQSVLPLHGLQRGTVVCILLDWDEARRSFIHQVQREGAQLKIIVVRDQKTSLPLPDDISVINHAQFEAGVEHL